MEDKITSLSTIAYDDFLKIDVRSGQILTARSVPKSEKLLELSVSFGPEIGQRTIVAGIAKNYAPEALVGAHVLGVINLAPRKMMGLESHGMLLAGVDGAGDVVLATCYDVPDGTRIG